MAGAAWFVANWDTSFAAPTVHWPAVPAALPMAGAAWFVAKRETSFAAPTVHWPAAPAAWPTPPPETHWPASLTPAEIWSAFCTARTPPAPAAAATPTAPKATAAFVAVDDPLPPCCCCCCCWGLGWPGAPGGGPPRIAGCWPTTWGCPPAPAKGCAVGAKPPGAAP